MASLAINLFGSSRPHRAAPPRFIPGEAGLLKDMSREIPLKWALLDGMARELARLAGTPPVPLRPEDQFFPIAAELAGGELRNAIAAEIDDVLALVAPAVTAFERSGASKRDVTEQAGALLSRITAVRSSMCQRLPAAHD